MFLQQHGTEVGEIFTRVCRSYQLIGIRTAFLQHGDGFSAPDQLGAASSETPPASDGVLSRTPVAGSVPAFHGLNGDSVPKSDFAPHQWLRQRRSLTQKQVLV